MISSLKMLLFRLHLIDRLVWVKFGYGWNLRIVHWGNWVMLGGDWYPVDKEEHEYFEVKRSHG